MLSHYGLYAYGLVDKNPAHIDIPGIDKKHQVYAVGQRCMYVVVSEINVDEFQNQIKDVISELTRVDNGAQQGTTELFQAHEQVIDVLMQDSTVIPLKFGTILKNEESALQMLQEHEDQFKHLLAKFKGKIEWGVKVYANKQLLLNQIEQVEDTFTDGGEKQAKLSKGTAYLLGKKKAQELQNNVKNRLAQIAKEIFQALEKEASEAKINKISSQNVNEKKEEMILNTVLLVEKLKEDHFLQHGKRVAEKYASVGVGLEFSGPWPPYNFT